VPGLNVADLSRRRLQDASSDVRLVELDPEIGGQLRSLVDDAGCRRGCSGNRRAC